MIDFSNVCFGYGETSVLKNVSFHIEKGEFAAVLGANGAGKTTLSKMFNGILKPSQGDVTVAGMNTKTTRTSKLAKHIGFLFQNPDRQICKNTVREEIMFGLECVSNDKDYCREQCEKTLESFGFDGEKDPFTMSRGERQKIALASVIAVEPEVLILDEPTTGLDYSECIHIMNIVSELNKKGTTVIMVTHDMEIVLDFAQKVLVMNHGHLLKYGNMREVMKDNDILMQARLMPPQIAGLAMRLDGFDDVFTNSEMLERLSERSRKK